LVTQGDLSTFLELCLWNIAETDHRTVEETILTFDRSVEIVSIFSVQITVLIDQLITIVCPGDPECNDRGQCVNSVCVCNEGIR